MTNHFLSIRARYLSLLTCIFFSYSALSFADEDLIFSDGAEIFFLDANGVTIRCPSAQVGNQNEVDGVLYTKRNRDQITTDNASTACTTGITDMSFLFHEARRFNQPIGSWDTSSVTNMTAMFEGASSFNQSLANWDTSAVTDMNAMFFSASSFNQDLGGWCVSQITTEPIGFDLDSAEWLLPRPVWGVCPAKFFLAVNGVTVRCPRAAIGDQGEVEGVIYTKRSRDQISTDNATTSCTTGITDMSFLFANRRSSTIRVTLDWQPHTLVM